MEKNSYHRRVYESMSLSQDMETELLVAQQTSSRSPRRYRLTDQKFEWW